MICNNNSKNTSQYNGSVLTAATVDLLLHVYQVDGILLGRVRLLGLELLVYELVLHHLAQLVEDLVHGLAALGAAFKVGDAVLLGELGRLLVGHLALLEQVSLGSNKHDLCGLLDSLRQFVYPVT